MPRRAFVADLKAATEGVLIAGISQVEAGGDDGEFTFLCMANGQQLSISCLVPELGDYPSSHMCMIFAPDNAPAQVANSLNGLSDAALGKSVHQILELVASKLESTDEDGDQQMMNSQHTDDYGSDLEESDDDFGEEYFPGDEDMLPNPIPLSRVSKNAKVGFTNSTPKLRARIRRDLSIAKAAGFKVGHQGGLMDGLACYVSLSVRVSKLGISKEAMQAWQLEPTEYLITILHYPAGYKSMDDLRSYDSLQGSRNCVIRVGISTYYKPTMQEAVQAFTVLNKEEEKRREAAQANDSQQPTVAPQGFRNSFISRPLSELLAQRFVTLIKYRYSAMPWSGAEAFYNDQILLSVQPNHTAGMEDKYFEPEQVPTAYNYRVTADHITDAISNEHSLPLVAMQVVLRHFVRCTEFCLICFNKMPDDLQAIKPYVCDNPLCLYQYMSLGFGPSIEHEILSQPKVVDLLVSFCYASAHGNRLRDFPSGLSLLVPPCDSNAHLQLTDANMYGHHYGMQQIATPQNVGTKHEDAIQMRWNVSTKEIMFADKSQPCPVVIGSWIIIRTIDDPDKPLHCRVIETAYYPTIKVSDVIEPKVMKSDDPNGYAIQPRGQQPAKSGRSTRKTPIQLKKATEFRAASFYIYNQNFDDLGDVEKRQAIIALLDLLPSVDEMRKYLIRKAQSTLGSWVNRLSPALTGLLRWIIASNRACIVQVAEENELTDDRKNEDRLYGMDGWAQFRFAMGAPDKERKFVQAVRETSGRLSLKYPTLFAFHGSPLHNWHSIIREGLHFNDTIHGRAYGNGVYHAPDVNTSLGYLGHHYTAGGWPSSDLQVQQALALNEIVNAPKEYVSESPHLVVAQLDWIQTRYLFVKTKQNVDPIMKTTKGSKPLEYLEQDPQRTPKGVNGSLVIPIRAISGARRPESKGTTNNKRQKTTGASQYDPIEIDCDDDDTASIMTLREDWEILDDDFEKLFAPSQAMDALPTPNSLKGDKGKTKISGFVSKLIGKPLKPLTDYVPGALDYSTLPMLQMPAWATSAATKRLGRDLQEMVKVQNETPVHELGWHIDAEKIENMYQWIVELHSFEHSLPLAQDMKKRNVKSVVLELRFGKEYPMSPPFVRVIRPRFLGFQQGGGGHVTAGGAMCMQLLTNDGWSAVSSIESVLLQVRMAISSTDPTPARLENGGRVDYGVGEAVEAYMRACAMHGWTVPTGFKEMAYGGASDSVNHRDSY